MSLVLLAVDLTYPQFVASYDEALKSAPENVLCIELSMEEWTGGFIDYDGLEHIVHRGNLDRLSRVFLRSASMPFGADDRWHVPVNNLLVPNQPMRENAVQYVIERYITGPNRQNSIYSVVMSQEAAFHPAAELWNMHGISRDRWDIMSGSKSLQLV